MLPLVVQVLTYITFKNIRYRSIFVDLIFFSGFALAIWIIVLYLSHLNIGGDFQARKLEIETPLGRSNYLAAYLVFIAALASFKRPALLPILVFSIFMTMSRGAFFALAFVFLSRLSFSHSKKSKLFPLSLILAACVVLIIGLHFSNSYTQTPHGVLQTIYNRFFLWGFSFHELSENFLHFLLGIGPNGFKTAIEQAPGVEQVVDPHNGFLIIWLNYGISGLILYCLFLIFGYRRIRQAVIFDPEMKGILLGIQAMMLYSFYETIIATVAFDMFFVLIVCLSIASYKHHTVSP